MPDAFPALNSMRSKANLFSEADADGKEIEKVYSGHAFNLYTQWEPGMRGSIAGFFVRFSCTLLDALYWKFF